MAVVSGDGYIQVVYSTPDQEITLDILKKPTGCIDVTTTDAEDNYSFFVIQPADLARVVAFLSSPLAGSAVD